MNTSLWVGDCQMLSNSSLGSTFQAANMTAIVSALAKQQSEGEEEYTSGGGGGVHGPGDSLTSSNGGSYGRHRKTSNSSDESGR